MSVLCVCASSLLLGLLLPRLQVGLPSLLHRPPLPSPGRLTTVTAGNGLPAIIPAPPGVCRRLSPSRRILMGEKKHWAGSTRCVLGTQRRMGEDAVATDGAQVVSERGTPHTIVRCVSSQHVCM